jgi:D-glycero-alpha-D-manno-heptose-7-phosphate kinase
VRYLTEHGRIQSASMMVGEEWSATAPPASIHASTLILDRLETPSVVRQNPLMEPGRVAYVRSRAPLRLGLGGGGTDVSPYCDQYGGAVLNVAIDLFAYTIIEPTADNRVMMKASDIDEFYEGSCDEAMESGDELILHRAVYRRIVNQFNGGRPLSCRITTFCDAPPGSGLGTSSTVVVSLVKAFAEWLNLPLGEYEIAHLAYEIERIDAKLAGGRQDQYAAAFGGVNFIEFYSDNRVIVNPLRVKNWIMSEFETSLVLFDSGRSRSSAAIIDKQTANLADKTSPTLEAMHELKADAIGMKECLLKGDLTQFALFMRKSWVAKKKLAKEITNARIDRVYEIAMAAGALAGKVSGAGGGGFMTFLVDPAHRVDVIRALNREEGRVMTCHATRGGSEGWKLF